MSVDDYRARSVLYVPDDARLSYLVGLPEGHDLGAAVDVAMRAIETHNPEPKDVLPKGYQRLEKSILVELSVYGQEQKGSTVPIAKMNLALHGLSGDIRLGNSYYDDLHHSLGSFDFVMASPPFNVNDVDKSKLEGDKRFPFGIPRPDNANYLWIQLFYSSLCCDGGRAGFVMANSAGDASHSERDIRERRPLFQRGRSCASMLVTVTSVFDRWDGVDPATLAGFDPVALEQLSMLAELCRQRVPVVLDTSCVRTGLHSQLAQGRVPATLQLAEPGKARLFMEKETIVETW